MPGGIPEDLVWSFALQLAAALSTVSAAERLEA
jgi:hypothetical protein